MSEEAENQVQSKEQPLEEKQQQQEEDTFQYFQPTKQQYQHKIFINNCNGYVGSQLVEAFRNDHEIQVNPNLIISNLDPEVKFQGQTEVTSIINTKDRRMLNSIIRKADIIVYVLNRQTAHDFEYIVKVLRKIQKCERQKRLICISSLLTWNYQRSSSCKVSVDDLDKRNSTQSYLLDLQNLCLDLNNLNKNIESFVICAGMVYGNGEDQLFAPFKRALQQSEKLKIYGTGTNKIPMIHVEDLSQMAQQLGFKGIIGKGNGKKIPRSNYYFGVDTSMVSQEQIMKTIAQTVGNGGFQSVVLEDTFLESNFQIMTLDMEIVNIPDLEIWHSKQGFCENIGTIVSEFNTYRGIKPNKIVLTGPPASGKTKITQILANTYGLPILDIKRVVDEVKEEQSEYAENIRIKLEELKVQRIQEERKAFEEAKKKKKGKGNQQFDPEKVVPRLADQDIIQIYKRRLNKSDCLNKGYILDGWPKSAKHCEALFMNENQQINEAIFPNAVFCIEANEEEVKERVKNLSTEIRQSTHWNEQATIRRFQTQAKYNEDGTVISFFEGKVDIKKVQFNYEGSSQFPEFVERNGPLGFKKKQEEKEKLQQKQEKQEKDEEKSEKKEEKNAEDEDQEEQQGQQEQQPVEESDQELNIEKLTQHEKDILNEKSRPIRQYLIDNVIPQITEGLLEICKDAPRDPIQFLIKFLESKERVKKAKLSQ